MAEGPQDVEMVGRFFCHTCSVEISQVVFEFQCPRCLGGFIEQLPEELTSDPRPELAEQVPNSVEGIPNVSVRPQSQNTHEPAENRQGRPRIQRFIHNFFYSITGMSPAANQTGMSPAANQPGLSLVANALRVNSLVILLRHGSDHALGDRNGFLANLMNEMNGIETDRLTKDQIKKIPVVEITESQVNNNLQCSICWEKFIVSETVRKLCCEHIYHENCIIPWLELNATCPVCRKILAEENHSSTSLSSSLSSTNSTTGYDSQMTSIFLPEPEEDDALD